MQIAVPAVLIFVAATLVLVRWFGMRATHAATAFLAGLFVAATSLGPHIHTALAGIGTWLSHL